MVSPHLSISSLPFFPALGLLLLLQLATHTIATLAKAAALSEGGWGELERNLCRRGPRGPWAEHRSQPPSDARNAVRARWRQTSVVRGFGGKCKKGGKRNKKTQLSSSFSFSPQRQTDVTDRRWVATPTAMTTVATVSKSTRRLCLSDEIVTSVAAATGD